MIRIIKEKIAVKISIFVNLILIFVLISGALFMIFRQTGKIERELLGKGIIESRIGARTIAGIIEEAIDNGVFTVKDAFDSEYVQIPGFDPPKYHTKYDFYLDKAILGIQDEFLNDESVIFAVAVDINGYLPTHNTKFNAAPTQDKAKDLSDNRTKRIFNDPVGIKAAKNMVPGFFQEYQRDTGEKIWDISSPIMVKGKHWGAFRVGLSLKKIEYEKRQVIISTVLTMSSILLVSLLAVFFSVKMILSPLKGLTEAASKLAEGNIEKKVELKSEDELGKLADVLERLRFSLKAAMERIAKKS